MTKGKLIRRKRALAADDLFKLEIITEIALSPDEKSVAYGLEKIDREDNKYFTNIHLLDLTSGKSKKFTQVKGNDRQLRWSPDGSQLAFVSTRKKKTGIFLIPVWGGSERKIIELDGGISSLNWMPDGSRLVFCLRYNDSHFVEDEKKKKEEPVFRHITKLFYRLDAEGFIPKDTFQVYSLKISTGKLTKITRGNRDNLGVAASPDGKLLAFVSNRSRDPHIESLREDLFVIPSRGGKERRIPTPAGPVSSPAFSPDSKRLAYLGHDNPDDAWGVTNIHVWTVGVTGRPKARNLMLRFDRMAIDASITDLSDVHDEGSAVWSADGKRIFFLSSDTGKTNVYYVPARGGKPTCIYKGKCHIRGLSLSDKTATAALIRADLNNPGDIVTSRTTYGGEKTAQKQTSLNRLLRSEVKLGRTREVIFSSFDGTRVQGWLICPPNFNANRRYPAILQIHGGPRVQYAHTFMHEMQYLAGKGYVVFYTNPRGGTGRGETWADAIAGGWGDLDYADCMAAADYLENLKFVNSKKIGVTGGSYGGYMTNWMIGHTNRFRAAVTQRSISDLASFVGSSDIGYDLGREFDGFPWTNPDNYIERSPMTYYKNVKTPVLIIHSEKDLRCHIEQAEQMFVMLKRLGKKVEMVRFPEEPHGLSRHGRPDRRIARLEWIVKWFDRYLK